MDRSALALLIFCNSVWALNPWMGKILLESFSGVQVAWFRYFGAFVAYLLFVLIQVAFFGRRWRDYFLIPKDAFIGLQLAVLGIGPFVFSPIMQFIGLETAQAMDNSILLATEPLITILLARAVLGEKMRRDQVIALAISLVGVLFFAGVFSIRTTAISIGVIFLLLAQIGEGAYSVFAKKLVADHEPKAVLGSALACGALLLTFFVGSFDRLPSWEGIDSQGIGAILWLGPLGSTITYLIWATITRRVTIPSMAITLFIQPVLGSVVGFTFLDERLTLERCFGAFLILGAVAFLAKMETRKRESSLN